MAIAKRLMKRGFTLIELMIVVVIIGILAALAIYGVQKYVSNSKSAEARTMLGRISKDQVTAYEGENQEAEILAFGATASISRRICGSAVSVPDTTVAAAVTATTGVITGVTPHADLAGKKWQPAPADFKTGDKNNGWACLDFGVTTPLYYGYGMTATANVPAEANDNFHAFAVGDLDGDGVGSAFALGGIVREESASKDLALVLATTVQEWLPEE